MTSNDEEEGEIGELKKQYSGKLSTIKEMFPDWTDEDIVFALRETDGDLEDTIERITEGMPTTYNLPMLSIYIMAAQGSYSNTNASEYRKYFPVG